MTTKYIINEKYEIEAVNYEDLVMSYEDVVKIPHGYLPRYYIRNCLGYEVGNNIYDNLSDAEGYADEIERETGIRPEIKMCNTYLGCTMHQTLEYFDTDHQAEDWLFKLAEKSYRGNVYAPAAYDSWGEAKEAVEFMRADGVDVPN